MFERRKEMKYELDNDKIDRNGNKFNLESVVEKTLLPIDIESGYNSRKQDADMIGRVITLKYEDGKLIGKIYLNKIEHDRIKYGEIMGSIENGEYVLRPVYAVRKMHKEIIGGKEITIIDDAEIISVGILPKEKDVNQK
jgi:hypothetical protein